ncbi:MAG: serine dehydratase subunit alpha family protein [Clostridia bacterium]|nr:serine dehydratase subunit alpha family protein [Clostridia bacterium]
MKNNMIELLKKEVKPAMGCTEPIAVALAGAVAREAGHHTEVEKVALTVSPNFYKNGLSVGIPQTNEVGLDVAVAIGAFGGDAENGLEVMKSVTQEAVKKALALVNDGKVSIDIKSTDEKIYIEATLYSNTGKTTAIIRQKHDEVYFIQHNDEIQLEREFSEDVATAEVNPFFELTIKEIIQTVETMTLPEIEFLLEGLKLNGAILKAGLDNKLGMGVGYSIKENINKGLLSEDLPTKAMYMTAAASDARMSGISMPVMSSNGSGNNGLTAIIPLIAYRDTHPVSDEKMAQALAMSHLINCYIKHFIGRLSAICSCGVSAATGASSAVTWLMGGSVETIEGTIQNMIGNISGLICDGAKNGCALKLATAASMGIHSAFLSQSGAIIAKRDGIVGRTVEESIRNLGVVGEQGMRVTDLVILDVMKRMED